MTAERPPIAFGPRRIGHVNLFVSDFKESCRFFSEVCGFEQTGIEPHVGAGFFSNGNTHHDIGFIECSYYRTIRKKYPDPDDPPGRGTSPGLNHFGWEMENEAALVAAYQRSVARGITPRITANGTSYSNYVFDIDGTQHQFYADNEMDWRRAYTGGIVDLHGALNWKPGQHPPSTEPLYDSAPVISRNPDAPLQPMKVTHSHMLVADIERTTEFYCDTGGFTIVHATPDGKTRYFAGSAAHYDVIVSQSADGISRWHHSAFELWPDSDLDEAAERLGAVGGQVTRQLDAPHKSALFLRHPDGFELEFFVRRDKTLAAVDVASLEERLYLA